MGTAKLIKSAPAEGTLSDENRPLQKPEEAAIHVVGGAILQGNSCLVARRAAHVSSAGLWEFPGGKIESGESPEQALKRELREELAIDIEVLGVLGRGQVSSPRAVVLDVFYCRRTGGEVELRDHDAVRWIGVDEVAELTWAAADIPVLPALLRMLKGRN